MHFISAAIAFLVCLVSAAPAPDRNPVGLAKRAPPLRILNGQNIQLSGNGCFGTANAIILNNDLLVAFSNFTVHVGPAYGPPVPIANCLVPLVLEWDQGLT